MKWLCDTNIISESMKPGGNSAVTDWLSQRDIVNISVITVEEVFCGLSYKNAGRQIEWFERFMELRCRVLPVGESTARRAGVLRGELRQRGLVRTQADLLIAATALEHDLMLATRNVKDFTGCGLVVHNPFDGHSAQ
jgi:predicted nucleic acid-binding protein